MTSLVRVATGSSAASPANRESRGQRLERLRDEVRSGRYRVDASALAACIIARSAGLLLAANAPQPPVC